KDGAGDRAGLKPTDLIVRFSDTLITSPRQLQKVVERKPIGSSHPLIVIRKGEKTKLTIEIDAAEPKVEKKKEKSTKAPAEQTEPDPKKAAEISTDSSDPGDDGKMPKEPAEEKPKDVTVPKVRESDPKTEPPVKMDKTQDT
ncbi:MAG: PDZ domain-containing protein, partial [Planctomycetota bacterium]